MSYTVITGASSGIGYEAALAFAKRGKNLILAARRKEKLEELKEKITEVNATVDVILEVVDLTESKQVYDFYKRVSKYELETFINNAGFGNYDLVSDQKLPKIEQMLHLNIEALTILTTLFTRDYSTKEGAQLINVSSGGGYTIVADAVTYCATKFYVSSFTEGLAQELQSKGLPMKAKVLAPAATETEFAVRALHLEEFSYEKNLPKYHTAKEMAEFMLNLYDSDKIVGIVNGESYEFQLRNPIFPYVDRRK